MQQNDSNIVIGAWNARGLNDAQHYIHHLLKKCDILVLSEHKLYQCQINRLQKIHHDFEAYGKSSKWLKDKNVSQRPTCHGGIGILWNKSLSPSISDPYLNA